MDSSVYTADDVTRALMETARNVSIPIRAPRWVKPPWWSFPLNVTRTRPVPAASGWIDLIDMQLGQTNLAPSEYNLRLCGYVATGENDPLVTGMTYRFLRNGGIMPSQEFDITDTIERHVDRQAAEMWPAFSRKIFMTIRNDGNLTLQVNNPSGDQQIAIAALYGYYYPDLGDISRGGMETGKGPGGHEDAIRDF